MSDDTDTIQKLAQAVVDASDDLREAKKDLLTMQQRLAATEARIERATIYLKDHAAALEVKLKKLAQG